MTHDYGPLLPFEVTWRSGHIETIMAHQVIWPSPWDRETARPRVLIHGEVDGRWTLILAADEADLLSVRRLTTADDAAADS